MRVDDERARRVPSDERELDALLRPLDHPAPPVSAAALAARARSRVRRGRYRIAAGLVLSLGIVGIAYAAPGSPLRALVAAATGRTGSGPRNAPAPPAGVEPSAVAGIAVDPGRDLVILFTSARSDGVVRVSLTGGRQVVVRAPIGAATWTSDEARLVVDNRGDGGGVAATFEIEIPRAAPRVEIRVAGVRAFLKEGARIASAGGPDPAGVHVLSLAPSRPGP